MYGSAQDQRKRRAMFARAGFCDPLPTKAQERAWAKIAADTPPPGEADGQFDSFITWVNKATSWIGWTGAKCFDAKDRPCRIGKDFTRARDEGAFPVRWYWPDRFTERGA